MNAMDVAWLVLRIAYAWLMLNALGTLIRSRQATVESMRPMFPVATEAIAGFMFAFMGLSAVSILIGLWGQIAGAGLVVFNLMGVKFHMGFAKRGQALASENPDNPLVVEAGTLALVGHTTSAQKNVVLAALGFFFAVAGTGPFSLTGPIFWGVGS